MTTDLPKGFSGRVPHGWPSDGHGSIPTHGSKAGKAPTAKWVARSAEFLRYCEGGNMAASSAADLQDLHGLEEAAKAKGSRVCQSGVEMRLV